MMAQKKATTLITLILFVLIVAVLAGIIGASFFYTSGAKAQTAGEQPFITLTQVQDKLVGNFPDLVIDPNAFQATCINGNAGLSIKVAVENLGKKTAESPDTAFLGGIWVCETLDGDPQTSGPPGSEPYAKISKLDPAGEAVVTVHRYQDTCPQDFTTTINADCENWVAEGNEDNNEIVRICSRNEIGPRGRENAPCSIPPYCTYTCRAP
jgi:hypothetical protein